MVTNPGLFLKELSDGDLDKILDDYLNEWYLGYAFEMTTFQGAIKQADYTSFAFPNAKWKFAAAFGVGSMDELVALNQMSLQWKTIVKESTGNDYLGEYINYIDYNTEDYMTDYFGDNANQLI